jgi:hypothetical protein
MSEGPSHTLTRDAQPAHTSWTKLWRWEALRYRRSGWWLDAILPHSPALLLVTAFAIPIAWFAVGYGITDDQAAYLETHDITGQLWFFPLHVISVRLVGGLWAEGLAPALEGLALGPDIQHKIRRGALGTGASLGALLACAFFIVRDTSFGFTPNEAGLIPFDDPDLWDFGALGRPVHIMMLSLWCVEWLMFGYLLWLQLWILLAWTRHLAKADLRDRLGDVLVGDGYRHSRLHRRADSTRGRRDRGRRRLRAPDVRSVIDLALVRVHADRSVRVRARVAALAHEGRQRQVRRSR